jgi:CheY-like chemotaxis protein
MNEKIILLVEDNPSDEALTLRALRKNNISSTVVVKRDGAEALDYLQAPQGGADRAFAPLPQLILLDLNLPKIDGLEVFTPHSRRRAHKTASRRDPHIVPRRYRHGQGLRFRSQRLCLQAG